MTAPAASRAPIDLTVVIASIDSTRSLALCLSHLDRACAGMRTEIIVVDASQDAAAHAVQAMCGAVALIRRPPGTLAPYLWAEGFRRSTGPIVAFSTSHCLVSPDWATALVRTLDAGATGAGGPLVIGRGTSPLDWAVFYLRYAGFMPHTLRAGRTDRDVAGDNAAYRRDSLERHVATLDNGFWEVDFHRHVAADGGWLSVAPDAQVEFTRSFSFSTIVRQRFAHGRHSGARRVAGGMRSAWQVVLAAPFVPFLLAARAGVHAVGGASPWRLPAAMPWFLPLATAWAIGEAFGALGARFGRSPQRPER